VRKAFRAYLELIGIGFRAAPWAATFQLVTGIVMAVSLPVSALGAKMIVDAAINRDLGSALFATAMMGIAVAGALTSVFYYVHCLFTVQERAGALASRRLMELVGGAEGLRHHDDPEYLDQVQRIREEQFRLPGMVNATAGLLRVGATIAVTTVLLTRISPWLLLLPVLAVLSFWLGRVSRNIAVVAQEATSEQERLRRHLFELGTSQSSASELRVYGLTGLLAKRHHSVSDTVLDKRNRASWKGAGLQSVDGAVNALGYVGAIALILWLVVKGQATVGDIVLVIGLAAQMSSSVGTAVMYGTLFLFVLKVGRRFVWLGEYAARTRRTVTDPAPVPDRLERGIELKDVRFGYGDKDVLTGLSLRLPAGAVVALVGENGAGKSTLVKLLTGMYQPDSGQVLVDGLDATRFDSTEWWSRNAGAFQDYARFEFTLRETVGVGDLPRIDDRAAVGTALERAGASALSVDLPDGLETQLGTRWDGGTELSGGQWQKLALARGLMRPDPLVAVFDEPTAALDAHAEHALFERFAQAARTAQQRSTITLLVSHRFSTVGMADMIVVLDGGKVREFGSHQELMSLGGMYAELYELQSRGYR
jgi:ATP-binding cassette subfamily B protein